LESGYWVFCRLNKKNFKTFKKIIIEAGFYLKFRMGLIVVVNDLSVLIPYGPKESVEGIRKDSLGSLGCDFYVGGDKVRG
jgi:hypothetical protein